MCKEQTVARWYLCSIVIIIIFSWRMLYGIKRSDCILSGLAADKSGAEAGEGLMCTGGG